MSDMKLKTIEDWQNSGCRTWDEYCKPGEKVDQEVADYFLDIIPPKIMTKEYFQVGEPHSYAIDPRTMKGAETYSTFIRCGKEIWEYAGNCYENTTTDIGVYKKRASVKDFLRETYRIEIGENLATRPRIYCNDGFSMSVQAGKHLYCEPRENLESGEYVSCEVGFPSEKEELLLPYIEDPGRPKDTVYYEVPIEVIEKVIEKHGGWFDSRIPFA